MNRNKLCRIYEILDEAIDGLVSAVQLLEDLEPGESVSLLIEQLENALDSASIPDWLRKAYEG